MGIKRYVALAAIAMFVGGLHAEQLRLQDYERAPRVFAKPRATLPSEAIKKLPDDILTAMKNTKSASQVLDKLVQTYKSSKHTPVRDSIFSTLGRGFVRIQALLKQLEKDIHSVGSEDADNAIKAAINLIQVEINSLGRSEEEAVMALVAVNSILNHARIKAGGQISTAKAPKGAEGKRVLESKMRAINDSLRNVYNVTNAMTHALNVSSFEGE